MFQYTPMLAMKIRCSSSSLSFRYACGRGVKEEEEEEEERGEE